MFRSHHPTDYTRGRPAICTELRPLEGLEQVCSLTFRRTLSWVGFPPYLPVYSDRTFTTQTLPVTSETEERNNGSQKLNTVERRIFKICKQRHGNNERNMNNERTNGSLAKGDVTSFHAKGTVDGRSIQTVTLRDNLPTFHPSPPSGPIKRKGRDGDYRRRGPDEKKGARSAGVVSTSSMVGRGRRPRSLRWRREKEGRIPVVTKDENDRRFNDIKREKPKSSQSSDLLVKWCN